MPEELTQKDFEDIKVMNAIEDLINDELPEVMKKFPNACRCRRCLADIKALSLNHIKPHYVSSDKGVIYERVKMMDTLLKVDAMKAITDAITLVSANPHHDKDLEELQ